MKIRYRRTGGIANVPRTVEVDLDVLPYKFQNLLRTLESPDPLEPVQSDDFYHELEFEDGKKICCTDSRCPPELLEFFDYLTQRP
jgi:Emfourin